MSMRVVGVVQARTQSTRLPGKVLLTVGGRTLLERMLARLGHCRQLDDLVVATTALAVDRPILTLAAELGILSVAGHPTDLIDRHLAAADEAQADVVVKIPSDCPLIDPKVVDQVVSVFRRANDQYDQYDYVSNLHPATWPDGNDVEVFSRKALETAFLEADRLYEREHTTPFIWDQPDRFRIGNVEWGRGRDLSRSHRLTVDYPEDAELIAAVFAAMDLDGRHLFSVEDIVAFLDANPGVRDVNAHRRNTGWPADHAHALRTGNRAPNLAAGHSEVQP
ncbi:MAG: glycosyltransferase family protein [Deltaproteobacteria bacterium]|nr:glycosyltransferase family protein [Deltaproteobacteria bacterium]